MPFPTPIGGGTEGPATFVPAPSLSPRTERSDDPGSRAAAPCHGPGSRLGGRGDSGGAEGPATFVPAPSLSPRTERSDDPGSRAAAPCRYPGPRLGGRGDSGGAEGPATFVPAPSLSPRTERSDDPGSRAAAPCRYPGPRLGGRGTVVARKVLPPCPTARPSPDGAKHGDGRRAVHTHDRDERRRGTVLGGGPARALGRADPILAGLIRAAGDSVLRPRNDPFFSLSRSIVGQQISVRAAEAVWRKLTAHMGAVTPGAVAGQTEDALRGCGLSRPKARYLLSLAEHFTEGALDRESWHRMDDDAVIERLVRVKGVGRWTAEMFLIFHLLRPDVLPVGDIGIRKAIARHFNDGVRPSPEDVVSIAEPWRPWRSVASWYLWRSLDAVPVEY